MNCSSILRYRASWSTFAHINLCSRFPEWRMHAHMPSQYMVETLTRVLFYWENPPEGTPKKKQHRTGFSRKLPQTCRKVPLFVPNIGATIRAEHPKSAGLRPKTSNVPKSPSNRAGSCLMLRVASMVVTRVTHMFVSISHITIVPSPPP